MKAYNYKEVIINDILDYIDDNVDFANFETIGDLEEHLNNVLPTEDSVTGNASGSYTFNTWEAEENICHNLGLLVDALAEYGDTLEYLANGAEACDVTIRCYLLPECITAALEKIEDDFNESKEEE